MGEIVRINLRTLKKVIDRIERKIGHVSLDDFMSYEFQNSTQKDMRLYRHCVFALNYKRGLSNSKKQVTRGRQ